MEWIKTILLGIIEGVTEFLPVSSTAHLLLAERWLGMNLDEPFWKMFAIFIQIGAILAVVVYFWNRIIDLLRGTPGRSEPAPSPHDPSAVAPFRLGGDSGTATATAPPVLEQAAVRPDFRPLWMLAIASAPVFIIGYLTFRWVEQNFASQLIIAASLAIGGLVMILIEYFRAPVRTERMEQITLTQALIVGFAQVLAALFPGTSRSAATIMGGMAAGMSRRAATEFSFFLAMPVMFAAAGYSLLKTRAALSGEEIVLLVIGTAVSFGVAWVVVAAFMEYIRRYSFIPFAIYRILLAGVVLAAYSL